MKYQTGAILSAAYCLGLGIPFILVGIFFDKSNRLRKFISRHGNFLTLTGGAFLILIGLLQVTGLWSDVLNSLRGLISDFAPVI